MKPDIKTAADLDDAIHELEIVKGEQKENLGDELHSKMESLKPRNLIKSSVAEIRSSPSLKKKILIGTVTTASVFLVKKLLPRRWAGGFQMMIATAVISAIVQAALTKNKTEEAPV